MSHPLLSIVVPAYFEEGNIFPLHERLVEVLGPIEARYDWELIIVNDGSTDKTRDEIEALASKDKRVKGIHFTRNFGQQPAFLAGIEHSKGDCVVTMDADLEQPPEYILKMLECWEDGYEIVHSVRTDHPDKSWFKNWSSAAFYKVFSFLSKVPMEPGMLDFRLIDRKVVEAITRLKETDFFLRGITTWIGFKQAKVPYQSDIRTHGDTKFPLWKMINFAISGITSFSVSPLRFTNYIGIILIMLSVLTGIALTTLYFAIDLAVPDFAITSSIVGFLMGVQFLIIGVLSEYVSRIHVEVKKRPRYFVATVSGDIKLQNSNASSSDPSL